MTSNDSLFRNYDNDNNNVENTYKNMLQFQTIEYVEKMNNKYKNFPNKNYKIWDLIDKLNNIVDESDPDTELPQIYHAFQTAESVFNKYINNNFINSIKIKDLFNEEQWNTLPNNRKKEYSKDLKTFYNDIKDWDWLPMIGFIHDLGKILLLEEFGELPQWSVVGDIFPLGVELSDNFVYYNKQYHKNNDSLKNKNIYKKNCGFNNIIMSFGHDSYLADLLEKNNTLLPKEAIYVIRFHSFYSWHTFSKKNIEYPYNYLAEDYDWYMLPLLKILQKSDLYSKSNELPNINHIKNKYNKYIEKYIPNKSLLI